MSQDFESQFKNLSLIFDMVWGRFDLIFHLVNIGLAQYHLLENSCFLYSFFSHKSDVFIWTISHLGLNPGPLHLAIALSLFILYFDQSHAKSLIYPGAYHHSGLLMDFSFCKGPHKCKAKNLTTDLYLSTHGLLLFFWFILMLVLCDLRYCKCRICDLGPRYTFTFAITPKQITTREV